jgi:putative oxidoreductase
MAINTICAVWAPRVLSILRIMSALLLLQHGLSKFFGFPVPWPPGGGPPALFALYWWAGGLEIVGGTLLLLGLFTHPVAFILSGEMAFAYFMGHAPQSFYPQLNRGETAVLFCFVFFYLAFAGAGPWSIDALRGRK